MKILNLTKFNMRRRFTLLPLFFFFLIGCSPDKPDEILLDFLTARDKDIDLEKAYGLLTNEDKAFKSFNEFVEMKSDLSKSSVKIVQDFISFQIMQSEVKGDTIYTTVKEKKPDWDLITKNLIGLAESFQLLAMDQKQRIKFLKEKFENYVETNQTLPTFEEEVIYTIIKEDGNFKIFLNFGLPKKMVEFEKVIEDFETKYDYEGAYNFAKEFYSKNRNKEIAARLKEIQTKNQNVAKLNKSLTIGSLEFTPLNIEVKNVVYFYREWNKVKSKTTAEKYFYMTYKVKNTSKAQVFSPRNFNSWSKYNFINDDTGNEMPVADLGYNVYIDEDKEKQLQPGEEITFHAVCKSPANENATRYLWTLKLRVNNQEDDYTHDFKVKFDNTDFKFN
jgi:predicted phage tail protein